MSEPKDQAIEAAAKEVHALCNSTDIYGPEEVADILRKHFGGEEFYALRRVGEDWRKDCLVYRGRCLAEQIKQGANFSDRWEIVRLIAREAPASSGGRPTVDLGKYPPLSDKQVAERIVNEMAKGGIRGVPVFVKKAEGAK